MTRRDRKSVAHPAPPGVGTPQGLRSSRRLTLSIAVLCESAAAGKELGRRKRWRVLYLTGGRGGDIYYIARWSESRNSNPKTLGLTPWRGRVRHSVSIPPSQLLCRLVWLCLPPPLSPFVCTVRTQMCAHVKDPISICRKMTRPHSRWYGNTKTAHRGNMWVAPYYGCSLSPVGSSPNFPCHCIRTRKLSNLNLFESAL